MIFGHQFTASSSVDCRITAHIAIPDNPIIQSTRGRWPLSLPANAQAAPDDIAALSPAALQVSRPFSIQPILEATLTAALWFC